jgi:hypothetical protein
MKGGGLFFYEESEYSGGGEVEGARASFTVNKRYGKVTTYR